MVFLQPLDLKTIFVSYFAGTSWIFYFLAIIFFTYLAAAYSMTIEVFTILMIVFVVMMAGVGASPLWIVGVLIIGILVGIVLKKIIG